MRRLKYQYFYKSFRQNVLNAPYKVRPLEMQRTFLLYLKGQDEESEILIVLPEMVFGMDLVKEST